MYAIRRIFIAVLLFLFLGIGTLTIAVDLAALGEATFNLVGLGVIASLIFSLGYLFAPMFHWRSQPRISERPWRFPFVVLGAVLILVIAAIPLRLIIVILTPSDFTGNQRWGLNNQQRAILEIVWSLVSLAAAALYARYPFPRSLRSNSRAGQDRSLPH